MLEKADFGAILKRTSDWMEKFSVAAAAFYFLQSNAAITAEKAIYTTIGFLIGSYILTIVERRFR